MGAGSRIVALAALVLVAGAGSAAPPSAALRDQAGDAADRGLRYLRETQRENGSWDDSLVETALALRAYLENRHRYNESDGPFITRPVAFLLRHVRDDGAVAAPGEDRVVTTAVAAYALHATGNPAYADIIGNARDYLRGHQVDERAGAARASVRYGGIADAHGPAPDLLGLYHSLETLRATGVDARDPLWSRALQFVTRRQRGDGGFEELIRPGGGPARPTGGSLAGVGLASLLLAGATAADPRVQAARDWLAHHLERRGGAGSAPRAAALFPHCSAYAKSLYFLGPAAVGPDHSRDWREDLIRALIASQRQDGAWAGATGATGVEALPAFATAQAVIALSYATAASAR